MTLFCNLFIERPSYLMSVNNDDGSMKRSYQYLFCWSVHSCWSEQQWYWEHYRFCAVISTVNPTCQIACIQCFGGSYVCVIMFLWKCSAGQQSWLYHTCRDWRHNTSGENPLPLLWSHGCC